METPTLETVLRNCSTNQLMQYKGYLEREGYSAWDALKELRSVGIRTVVKDLLQDIPSGHYLLLRRSIKDLMEQEEQCMKSKLFQSDEVTIIQSPMYIESPCPESPTIRVLGADVATNNELDWSMHDNQSNHNHSNDNADGLDLPNLSYQHFDAEFDRYVHRNTSPTCDSIIFSSLSMYFRNNTSINDVPDPQIELQLSPPSIPLSDINMNSNQQRESTISTNRARSPSPLFTFNKMQTVNLYRNNTLHEVTVRDLKQQNGSNMYLIHHEDRSPPLAEWVNESDIRPLDQPSIHRFPSPDISESSVKCGGYHSDDTSESDETSESDAASESDDDTIQSLPISTLRKVTNRWSDAEERILYEVVTQRPEYSKKDQANGTAVKNWKFKKEQSNWEWTAICSDFHRQRDDSGIQAVVRSVRALQYRWNKTVSLKYPAKKSIRRSERKMKKMWSTEEEKALYKAVVHLHPECKRLAQRGDDVNEYEWDWHKINRLFHVQRDDANISAPKRSVNEIEKRWEDDVKLKFIGRPIDLTRVWLYRPISLVVFFILPLFFVN